MVRHVTIDPITRLEGHGKIDILLNESGGVDRAYFQVPELRGFEKLLVGRPAEDAAQITSRICGVCPMAHHMAATKAKDDLFDVECAHTGRLIREFCYNTFTFEDHALHFYFLGGPDFVVGPDAPKAERKNLLALQEVSTMSTPNVTVELTPVIRDFVGPRLPEQMDERFKAAMATKTASR